MPNAFAELIFPIPKTFNQFILIFDKLKVQKKDINNQTQHYENIKNYSPSLPFCIGIQHN